VADRGSLIDVLSYLGGGGGGLSGYNTER
jgi:hypothetical protein